MFSDYAIYIRGKDGVFRDRLVNIESVKIIETLNDPGSWTIGSTTPERCPFKPGDGIVVYKNGTYYYSGLLKKISENYDSYEQLYSWSAQGASDLEFLNRRICYVDPETASTTEREYYIDSGDHGLLVKNLIDRNIGPMALKSRKEPLITETPMVNFGKSSAINLRFPMLLTTIVPLLNAVNGSIIPYWDADARKLTYEIHRSNDLSELLLFSTELNSVISAEYKAEAPVGNFIMSAGQGEMTERSFATAENPDSIDEWGRIEFYHDVRSTESDNLQTDADTTLEKNSAENVGYSAELNTDAAFLQYRRDWNIGDHIGIVVHGQTMIRRVLQVVTELTYERETVTPIIGTVERGKFENMFRKLSRLREDYDYLSWSNS